MATEWPETFVDRLRVLVATTLCTATDSVSSSTTISSSSSSSGAPVVPPPPECAIGILDPEFADFVTQVLVDDSMPIDEQRTTVLDMIIAAAPDETGNEELEKFGIAVDYVMSEWKQTLLPLAQEVLAAKAQEIATAKAKAESEAEATAAAVAAGIVSGVDAETKRATMALFYQQEDSDDETEDYGDGEPSTTTTTANSAGKKKSVGGAIAAGTGAAVNPNLSLQQQAHLKSSFDKRLNLYDGFVNELNVSGNKVETTGMGRRAKRNALKGSGGGGGSRGGNGGRRRGGGGNGNYDEDDESGGSGGDDDDAMGVTLMKESGSGDAVPIPPQIPASRVVTAYDPMEMRNTNHEFAAAILQESRMKQKAEVTKAAELEAERAAAARAAKEIALNSNLRARQATATKGRK